MLTAEAQLRTRLESSVFGRGADALLDGKGKIRRDHLRRALALIASADPVTRASLARSTGLTTATTSSLVNELIALGLVVEGEQAESTGGKPGTRVEVNRAFYAVCVVIVRAQSVETVLLDLSGARVLTRESVHPAGVTPADVVAVTAEVVREFRDRVLAVCLQSPGVTDGSVVRESVLLGWKDVPLADLLAEEIDVPAVILNDADGEALTESAFDEVDGVQRLVLRMGEGIGAAVTIDGRVLPGATSRAGEIGHVAFGGRGSQVRCRCGGLGCIEAVASLTAVLGPDFHDELEPDAVRALLRADGAEERMLLGAEAVAAALRILSGLTDPHEIVIAGRAPLLGDPFLAAVREGFATNRAKGTASPPIRFAHESDPALGPGRLVLGRVLGVSMLRPAVYPSGS
ncbi:ROK family transcriptional regulator [Microbacterium maritypicum]|uniref:ROK family transcriptional regulator n=1 Tax=Microbacterium maritypicum TaxID=33918 RepID=UPI0037F3EFFF